jgi:hypothetical protein
MRMTRLTDNDRHLGPITYARCSDSWRPLRLVYSSGGGDEGAKHNHLTVYAFAWVARVRMPALLKPWRRWVPTGHYEWAKSPDAGYFDEQPREYGFSLSEGFLQVFMGAQTGDSDTTQSWAKHLPWTQWRFHRFSLYDAAGAEFWTQIERRGNGTKSRDFDAQREATARCDKAAFLVDDYDGQRLTVTTHIEEREWKFGEGWFKWLSLFRKPKVSRSLSIEFDKECGPEKGSWKGGLCGTSIAMLPGELHEAAFRRYCDQEHRSKYSRYRITFVGPAPC